MTDKNKEFREGTIYALKKAIAGSVPIVGAAASELLGLLVTSPLEKRREKFLTEVGERLRVLEEKKVVEFDSLQDNEQFIDTVLQATTYALKSSEAEKIIAFQNAIINTASGDCPDKTVGQIFLNLVDSFTTWHIKILHFFKNPTKWFEQNGKTAPRNMMGSLSTVLFDAFPELSSQSELVNLIWADLGRSGLHNTSGLNTMMTGNGLLVERTTDLGNRFLDFISSK